MSKDEQFMRRAIEFALRAEQVGNPPVGAVITLNDEVVAEAGASLLIPKFDGTRHAEMEALRMVPQELWSFSHQMNIYTTLEPCLMCFASILIHGIGRIVFGALDPQGGASSILDHLPPYFRKRMEQTEWVGHIMPEACDPLFERLVVILENTQRELI
jgi:tRNA(adenine34) deaminase